MKYYESFILVLQGIFIGNINQSTRIKEFDNNYKEINDKNVIVPWITIESKNDIDYFSDFLKELNILSKKFNSKNIVLIPFAHLSNKIPSHKLSFDIFNKLKIFLENNNYKVKTSHFGSYKDVKFHSPASPYQVMFRSFPNNNFKKTYYK